ncbi:MAG: bifunctional acetaldehyde-CoA/alcohol dehydrogenase [Proteobacteria bacterium]|nr:MAG: bifunctional acetaldehyde-CoA/alcohol dehydrogenase [Pseudomonadota bacterium]
MGETKELDPQRIRELDAIVARAREATDALRRLDQAAVDRIVWEMVVGGLREAVPLAQLALEETGFGVFEDKVVKNYVATEFLYDYLKDKKTVGVIREEPERNLQYVAEPIGVVMAILPVTNPTSTALFKAIVGVKTRNAMLFRPSPRAIRCAERSIEVLSEAGARAGLPPGALQVIPDAPREVTHYLFHHPGIDLIWTTGGPKIVALANAAGKPVISVGPGNAPVYLHRSADVRGAVVDILISKTFDASVICPAEQTCVVDDAIWDATVAEFQRMGARLLAPAEVEAIAKLAFTESGDPNIEAVGRSPAALAEKAGFRAEPTDKVLLAPLPSDLAALGEHPLVHEKLMPVLGLVRSPSVEHGVAACELVTERGGLGHTSAVYARDESVVDLFARRVRTGRILVNAPTAVGALGGIYNSLTPTFSLGCGTWGGSCTTANVNVDNLMNVKVVSRRATPPQWFRVPSDTYFNAGALENLRQVEARTAVIVTDADGERRGVADEVRKYLRVSGGVHVFSEIEPEPDERQIRAGVETLQRMAPDLLVAVGGGSVLDAAKAMRLFFESPGLSVSELALPFLDARKRVAQYPRMAHAVRLVAIPTTSGTGSEVSPAAVVTEGRRKVTLVDYSLVPDMAIVDPNLTISMPPRVTADTGVNALTHALEAGVSIFASPYTEAFCVQAVRLILEHLPRAVADGSDLEARTAMANAATLAGLAFSNAFVGVNHALAHAVGARFGLSHGCANGIFLSHVLRYNASLPTKFMPAPGYSAYVAPEQYARLGWVLGLGGHGEDERRERFFASVDALLDEVGIPRSLAAAGVARPDFEAALPDLARAAFEDPSLRTNPRMPLVRELVELLEAAWRGR